MVDFLFKNLHFQRLGNHYGNDQSEYNPWSRLEQLPFKIISLFNCGNNISVQIENIEAQIAALETDYNTAVTNSQPIIDGFDGLMARINALGKLPWFPSFFIFLLFLAIETAPIIAKLLAPKGEFDYKFEEQESVVATWVTQKVEQRKLLLATEGEINQQIYADIKNEEELYRYKKEKAEELLRLQADSFHNVQVKGL